MRERDAPATAGETPALRRLSPPVLTFMSHTGRLPIPEPLWAAAPELAREHGIFPTAKALHLEYGKLKQRAEVAGPVAKERVVKVPAGVPRRKK